MASHKVFLYGTLKRGEPNYYYLTDRKNGIATFISVAETVKTYPLIIDTKYNIPFLIRREGVGHNILGEIYEVDDNMMTALDELEHHPDWYCREEEEVKLIKDNKTNKEPSVMKCWIYFIPDTGKHLGSLLLNEYHSNGHHGRAYVEHESVDAETLKSFSL